MADEFLRLGTEALRAIWPGARLVEPTLMAGSDRTVVARATVIDGPVESVVVKRHLTDSGERVREPAALEVLAGVPGVPRLLAVHPTESLLVMNDLGGGTDVAQRLLGSDPQAAAEAVTAWATALGALQASSAAAVPEFGPALTKHAQRLRDPRADQAPTVDAMSGTLAAAADQLAAGLPGFGVEPGGAALEELRGINALIGGPASVHRLTPSDACPDNNVFTSDGLALLDFEGAQVRHVAWDAAYLTVPWPTCWCSWQLPDEVSRQALAGWKRAFNADYCQTEAFTDDLHLATVGWDLISTAWFFRRASENDPDEPNTPAARARVQHRLAEAVRIAHPQLTALTALAEDLLAATITAWGVRPLELAPAFRG